MLIDGSTLFLFNLQVFCMDKSWIFPTWFGGIAFQAHTRAAFLIVRTTVVTSKASLFLCVQTSLRLLFHANLLLCMMETW